MNQVELSYWNPQPELLKVRSIAEFILIDVLTFPGQWSKENGVLLEAYSPLGSAERVKESLNIPIVCHANFSCLQCSDARNLGEKHCEATWDHPSPGVYFVARPARDGRVAEERDAEQD